MSQSCNVEKAFGSAGPAAIIPVPVRGAWSAPAPAPPRLSSDHGRSMRGPVHLSGPPLFLYNMDARRLCAIGWAQHGATVCAVASALKRPARTAPRIARRCRRERPSLSGYHSGASAARRRECLERPRPAGCARELRSYPPRVGPPALQGLQSGIARTILSPCPSFPGSRILLGRRAAPAVGLVVCPAWRRSQGAPIDRPRLPAGALPNVMARAPALC